MDVANTIPTKYRGDPHEGTDTIVVNPERGLAPHGSMQGERELSPPLSESEWRGQTFIFKASHYTRSKDGAPSPVSPPLSADADKGDQDPLVFDTTQVTHPANYSRPRPGDPSHPLAKDGHPPTIAYNIYPAHGQGADLEASPTNVGNIGGRYAASERGTRIVQGRPRRLTPRECERLHGFPDDWTRWALIGDELVEQKDTPRYRALGNAVSVPVSHWIGERIRRAHESA